MCNLDNWREILAALVTYANPDEFSPLCGETGEGRTEARREREGRTEARREREGRTEARREREGRTEARREREGHKLTQIQRLAKLTRVCKEYINPL